MPAGLNPTFRNKPNLSLSARRNELLCIRGKHLPELPRDPLFRAFNLLSYRLKPPNSIGSTSCPPLDRTITNEEAVYLIFNILLGLSNILADFMSPQRGCGITKSLPGTSSVSNTLAGAREKRILYL